MQVLMKKWGDSRGIRVPKDILDKLEISSDRATFDISVENNKLILTPIKKESALMKRFSDFDYETYWDAWEDKHPQQSKELDWGKPQGQEVDWGKPSAKFADD
ncbi:AbrB/MazE/SpoVT family DNA-binding domain-containing protein [Lactobacillus sp. ESL0791]|uniref:AbrB/MazE/SpoVT family DNA-binding domain-containing protein n=1 Tax=Lactobacillus sp. ESL0791 TaxID=2983234 RepID=UPI0023F8BDE7|nr:AbrB/MazE/SpoVT family DNA-binding domain-containing protein [Lactobacillus sp. ESL0791]MDF7638675.1 AbrB/MazE/SpoVT family DNA-binding domain-containing protein [Lactobacillus sp. ESL0791]